MLIFKKINLKLKKIVIIQSVKYLSNFFVIFSNFYLNMLNSRQVWNKKQASFLVDVMFGRSCPHAYINTTKCVLHLSYLVHLDCF